LLEKEGKKSRKPEETKTRKDRRLTRRRKGAKLKGQEEVEGWKTTCALKSLLQYATFFAPLRDFAPRQRCYALVFAGYGLLSRFRSFGLS
jgi:hypothetical protein